MEVNQQYKPAELNNSELQAIKSLENQLRTETEQEVVVIAYTKDKIRE
ncbi:hypothetical protein [Neobacillus cucumis]|nr:hypothetical protein [Neobacillus cucumis]